MNMLENSTKMHSNAEPNALVRVSEQSLHRIDAKNYEQE